MWNDAKDSSCQNERQFQLLVLFCSKQQLVLLETKKPHTNPTVCKWVCISIKKNPKCINKFSPIPTLEYR